MEIFVKATYELGITKKIRILLMIENVNIHI